jgi:hypothetical protein
MCGIFRTLYGEQDIKIASIIVVIGEIVYMIVFRVFSTSELRETYKDIL